MFIIVTEEGCLDFSLLRVQVAFNLLHQMLFDLLDISHTEYKCVGAQAQENRFHMLFLVFSMF